VKYSKREADLRFRGVKGGLKASQPLELVIMDHTIVDNCLVRGVSRRAIVGAALAMPFVRVRPARAAEFEYKAR
jgi:hypothetical protein